MTPRARTRAWTLYETGRDYNCRQNPNQYNLVRTNTEFFIGNQWLNLPDTPAMRALPKPTFNILKRVASLFIASLTGNAFRMRVEPLFDASDADTSDADTARRTGPRRPAQAGHRAGSPRSDARRPRRHQNG